MPKFLVLCLLLLATTFATSTRILNDITPQSDPIPQSEIDIPAVETPSAATNAADVAPIPDEPSPVIAPVPDLPNPVAPPLTTPTVAVSPTTNAAVAPIIADEPAPVIAPGPDLPNTNVPPLTGGEATSPTSTNAAVAPPALPNTKVSPLTGGAATAAAGHPTFSFFMHDILGGSHPSGRAVAGIVASSDANNLPFSKTNNQIFPINGGVPLNTINGVINNNNIPFLVGLDGSPSNTVVQSNGNSVVAGSSQPFVTAGQLPAGLTVQQLMFGSVTVVDNEVTEGHELGSAVLGRAQGFYLTSSSDGSSHTLVLTAVFHGGDHGEILDTVSFFGVHRTATPISHIAIVGGTGKYENAKGFAAIETLPHVDQHTTDGVETITHFTLYLTP
ncbi:Disease resistance-responsive family protein [Perilla frutescens var. hirtella]|nr:Disease resistance-responsive family protein [Perilla frutescens var. hirtella]